MASGKSLGVLTLDLTAKIGGFTAGMGKAERELDKRAKSIEARAKKMGMALGVALAAAGAAAAVGVRDAINAADKLNDMSAKLGIGVDKLSAWGYAAGQAGTDIATLETGLTKLNKAIAEGMDAGSAQAKVFDALGISIDAASDATSLLPQIADRFAGIESAATKTKLAMELFGKSGAELIPFLEQGAGGLAELEARAAELGIVLDTKTAKAAGEFNDRLDDLKAVTDGLWNQLAGALLPALNNVAAAMSNSATTGGGLAKVVAFIGEQAEATTKDLAFFIETARELAALAEAAFKPRGGVALERYNRARMFDNVQGGMTQGSNAGDLAKKGVDAAFDLIAQPLPKKFDTAKLDKYLAGTASRAGTAAKAVRSVNVALREHAELIPEIDRRALEHEQAIMDWRDRLEDLQASMAGPVAEAMLEHERALQQVRSAYAAGQMSVEDFTEWQRVLADQLAATTGAMDAQLEISDALAEQQAQWDFVQDASTDALADILSGSKSARSAVDDLAMSIRQMLAQWASNKIMESLFGMLGGSPASQGASVIDAFEGLFQFAKGGAFNKGRVIPFANGGVVSAPSFFPMAGATGLMGEAGPEAIMPLARGSDGKLGVRMHGGGGMVVNNTINVPRNTSYETAAQVASRAGSATARSMRRNG